MTKNGVAELKAEPREGTKKRAAKAVAITGPNDGPRGITGKWDEFGSFLKDVRNEMRKVTTPSRKEVQNTTVVVIITVFLFAAFFYVVDRILDMSLDVLLRKLTGH